MLGLVAAVPGIWHPLAVQTYRDTHDVIRRRTIAAAAGKVGFCTYLGAPGVDIEGRETSRRKGMVVGQLATSRQVPPAVGTLWLNKRPHSATRS